METNVTNSTDEIDLQRLAKRLRRGWMYLLAAFIIGFVVVFGICKFLVPKTYESKATIYVHDTSTAGSILKNLPMMSQSKNSYYSTVLESDTINRTVCEELDLMNAPGFASGKGLTIEEAIDKLKKQVAITDDKSGRVDIVARVENPDLAASIANSFLKHLSITVKKSLNIKSKFLKGKIQETTDNINKAQKELTDFQEKNKTLLVDEETKGLIEASNQINTKIADIDMELSALSSSLANSGDLETLVKSEVRRRALQSSRTSLMKKKEVIEARLDSLPPLEAQYVRIQRKLEIFSKTLQLYIEQYEMADTSPHGENGDYDIIDRATPKYKPVAPASAKFGVLAGVVFTFLMGLKLINAKVDEKTLTRQ